MCVLSFVISTLFAVPIGHSKELGSQLEPPEEDRMIPMMPINPITANAHDMKRKNETQEYVLKDKDLAQLW